MAQNIGIYLVGNLHGNNADQMQHLDLNFAEIRKTAGKDRPEQYPWITSIDEYGHTYINHFQAKHLIEEINQLDLVSEQKEEAQKICEALRNLDGEQLLYFDGD